MRELSLFTGAGGGLLGTLLLGWTPIGYVEWNEYCQQVIAQRIADGVLPAAPIFTDVREFVQSGAAAEYRGFADVVTGGFPCQPFSVAGKRQGADDERNMWPATIATIRAVRPRFAFLENVPGLVTSGYFGTVLGDLVESGYDVRWRILSAAEVGAPHKRDRLWIVADRGCAEWRPQTQVGKSDAEGANTVPARRQQSTNGLADVGSDVAHAERKQSGRWRDGAERGQRSEGETSPNGGPGNVIENGWWETERGLDRVVDGMAHRVDRLKAIGNGQVPLSAAVAFLLLAGDIS